MAFAPHTNQDVRQQIEMGLVPSPLPLLLGQFREADHGHMFEYAERRWFSDHVAPEMPHVVYVGTSGSNSVGVVTRLAKVLKTVAYIVVDEDENGNPVIEKWSIKQHRAYS